VTRIATALVAVLALALLAGCGGDKKTIPSNDAASLIRALRQARDLAGDPKKCPDLQIAVQRVNERVASLPASVDKDTRDSLVNGTNNLIDAARSDCQNVQTTPTTPTQSTPTTPPPTTPTTPSNTTPTTPTAPPPTTPTTPPATTPTAPNGGAAVPPGQGKKGGKKKEGGAG
jgi:hypothetical protein